MSYSKKTQEIDIHAEIPMRYGQQSPRALASNMKILKEKHLNICCSQEAAVNLVLELGIEI